MNHSCREAGADWSTCWHAGTCGCRPPAQLPQLADSFPPNNRMAASYWLEARQSGPSIGWQTTVGAVLLAGCHCGVAGTLQHRISRLHSGSPAAASCAGIQAASRQPPALALQGGRDRGCGSGLNDSQGARMEAKQPPEFPPGICGPFS